MCLESGFDEAYDSVNWGFLIEILMRYGFPPKFIHWVEICITTPKFSISINGELEGFFRSFRG